MKLLQFYKIDAEILLNKALNSTEKLLLAIIESFKDKDNGSCFFSNAQFCEVLGIQKQALLKALKHLEDLELVKILYVSHQGVHSNRFIYFLRHSDNEPKPSDIEKLKSLIDNLFNC